MKREHGLVNLGKAVSILVWYIDLNRNSCRSPFQYLINNILLIHMQSYTCESHKA